MTTVDKNSQREFKYRDESGTVLYVVETKKNGAKAVRRPDPADPNKWLWSVDNTRRLIYRLHEITQISTSETIFLAPDEEQADIIWQKGLFATTHAFGPGHWDDGYARQLAKRPVVILVPGDAEAKDHAERMALALVEHAESVKLLELPDGAEGFFGQGRKANDLLKLADETAPWSPSLSVNRVGPYESTSAGMFWYKPTTNGVMRTCLANFNALITHEIEIHDGSGESVRQFEITAKLRGREYQFSLSAAEYGAMNWVPQHLGAEAIILPGSSLKEHTRAGIQILSGSIPKKRRYTHLGWTKLGDRWVYLHAGGAIGAHENGPDGPTGPLSGGSIDLGSAEILLPEALRRYVLPEPPTGERLRVAVRASLQLRQVGPLRITVPILGAVYRAPLGQGDVSLFLVGPTGVRKSELASRGQQHFGAEMDARHLPGSWSSTANALEAYAYLAKDALLTIDDFLTRGGIYEADKLNAQADRIFRGQGNNAGRARMRADQTLAATKYPRGLVLSTGEIVPTGQSLRGRLVIVDVGPGDVDLQKLTECQQDGQQGLYADSLAGYIQWLAPRYEQAREHLKKAIPALRQQFITGGQHPRSPENLAHLAYGYERFLTFAVDIGAITAVEKEFLYAQGCDALRQADQRQMEYQMTSEPTQMFIDALCAALRAGRAHLICDDGTVDEDPETWGWRHLEGDVKPPMSSVSIGWLKGNNVYLQPEKAFTIAQQMAKELGEPLGVTLPTLQKRLFQKGRLKSRDEKRGRNTQRVTINYVRQTVLHLDASLFQDTAQQAQTAQFVEQVADNPNTGSEEPTMECR